LLQLLNIGEGKNRRIRGFFGIQRVSDEVVTERVCVQDRSDGKIFFDVSQGDKTGFSGIN
jgi:hypothetical protein